VFGNISVGLMIDNQILQDIIQVIFSFHIPLFAFVSGYFSRTFIIEDGKFKHLFDLMFQYSLFQGLYLIADSIWFQTPNVNYSFFEPYWMLWFLFSLFFWRVLLLIFEKSNHVLVWAVISGIVVGFWSGDGTWMSLSRTLIYFPFFVIGYRFNPVWISKIVNTKMKLISMAFLVTLFVIYHFLPFELEFEWFLGNATFAQLNRTPFEGMMIRMIFYVVQFISSFCVVILVSSRTYIFAEWGQRTIYVYLLHGLVLMTLNNFNVLDHISIPIVFGLALAITLTLVHPFIQRMHPLIDPKPIEWFHSFRKQYVEELPRLLTRLNKM
jgi:fucose 4-O-acetylase-like acetyltransferase